MRRATWGWVVLSLVLVLVIQGCSLRREAADTNVGLEPDPATTLALTSTAPAATMAVDESASATVAGDKPTKPFSEEGEEGPAIDPLPTRDRTLDAWTILVYMSASSDVDREAMEILADMAAAGEATDVNVVLQLDRDVPQEADGAWAGARRYRIAAAGEAGAEGLELLEELGATNMGDPDSLTSFIQWGHSEFPANQYALFLWGESAGWRGMVRDSGDDDDLSVGDLSGALDRALAQSDRTQLDVIVLEGALTAHLEILTAVQPFTNYVVAAPGLYAPADRDIGGLLASLYDDTMMSPDQFALEVAKASIQEAPGALPTNMEAVDLRQLSRVNRALEELSEYLIQRAELSAATLARARQVAQLQALPSMPEFEAFTSIDLVQFASQLANFAPSPELARHGKALAGALQALAVAPAKAEADEERGRIGIAFLAQEEVDNPNYRDVDAVRWQEAMRAFYEASAGLTGGVQGNLATRTGEMVGAQNPMLLGIELRAVYLERAFFTALRSEPEDKNRLLYLESLIPSTGPGGVSDWSPGVFQEERNWDTTAAYVSDGANGDFVPLWPAPGTNGLFAVPVQYIPSAEEAGAGEAMLLLDPESQSLDSIWRVDEHASGRRLRLSAGDRFQLYNIYLESDARLSYEPGVTLVYSDGVDIGYDFFPLPSGEYELGLLVEESTERGLIAPVSIAVANEDLLPGYQTYLNADYGFQFLYPLAWPVPVFDSRRVTTSARQRGPSLTVSVYPGSDASAAQLKAQTLGAFGDLDILYEESVTVDAQQGLLTAYGYNAADGPHTGIFVTFTNSEQDVGYVIDVDGLALDENTTVDTARHVVESWQFVPIERGPWPDQWSTTKLDTLAVSLPPAYKHETLENGWELFKDGEAFLAMRTGSVSGQILSSIAAHWTDVAGQGVDAFSAEEAKPFVLGDSIWSRVAFSYEGEDGPISGLILATVYGGQEIVAWAEAPAGRSEALFNEVYSVAIAGSLPHAPGTSGVFYEDTFDEAGTWGVGRQEGATGAVTEGIYELGVDAPRGFFWAAAGVSLDEGVYEALVAQRSGSFDSGFGLLLGVDSASQSFYVFEISADGYVWIGRCQDNCDRASTLVDDGWFFSEAIQRGLGVANALRVHVEGQQLRFFINGRQVGLVDDVEISPGDVALFAETFEGTVVTHFDDLSVTIP